MRPPRTATGPVWSHPVRGGWPPHVNEAGESNSTAGSTRPTAAVAGPAASGTRESRWLGAAIGVRAGAGPAVEATDRRQVVRGQLEIEDVDVLLDPRGCHRFRDDDNSQLDVPAKHDLRRCLAVRAGQPADHRVGEDLTAGQGAPCLRDDVVRPVEGTHLLLLQERVELDLVDGGYDGALVEDGLQMPRLEI